MFSERQDEVRHTNLDEDDVTTDLRVSQIGDYSVSNWGDQLYPSVTKDLFVSVGLRAETKYFAPLPGRTPEGDHVGTLRDVARTPADLVLVGGGDLIRFDTRTVAFDHMALPQEKRRGWPMRLRSALYARRHFLPGAGVWLPAEPWRADAPTVLMSVGSRSIPESPAALAAVRRLAAVWTRTDRGAENFRRAGVDQSRIVLAPDAVFAHPAYRDAAATAESGRRLISDRLDIDEPLVIFHAATFHGWPQQRVEAALRSIVKDAPVAVLPLGAYSGEDQVLAKAAASTGAHALPGLRADEITSVMAAAGVIFTTSMHAAIVAGSFGTPVLAPSVKKTNEAFATCPLPPRIVAVSDEDIASAVSAHRGQRLEHDPTPNATAVQNGFNRILQLSGAV